MRRFWAVLVAVAFAASAAVAAHGAVAKTSGGEAVQLVDGVGFASVRNRGTFIGRVRRGKIVATRNVRLGGCERRGEAGGNMIRCKGRWVTVNTIGANRWRVRLRGHGISASGIVRGCLTLDARNSGEPGRYSIGAAGDFHDWPRSRKRFKLGSGSC